VATRFPVVTGLGIVTAAGCGVDEVWHSIARGECGLKPLTLFESPRYGQILTGEIRRDLSELGAPLRGSRSDRLGWLAAREAITSSKIDLGKCGDRAGVLLGSSVGGSFDSERFLTTLIKRGQMHARPTRFHECVSAVDLIADEFCLFGPSMAIATACSSGALAIATAAELIMSSQADAMLAGGADSLSRMTWGGFHSLLLVDATGCRPFDSARAGMSLGEGGAVLMLESEETARERGANILARLTGWGASCDAHHATAPHPEGAGALAAMQSALRRARLEHSAINYVNAHGTGTRDNDLAESKALRTLFGERIPPISSTKRFFGHALAASGAIEAVVCIEALRRQELPPNAGFKAPDPAIGIEPVTSLQRAPLTHVMSNSFGFGGNNAVLIFSRPEVEPLARPMEMTPAAIIGMGVIGPGTAVSRDIDPPLPAGKVLSHDCGTLDTTMLSPNQRRRTSRLIQMALIAARRSHNLNSAGNVAVAIGTGMGCLGSAALFLENLISKDEREPMPAQFPSSVHNAPAGQVAMDLGARGMNSAPTVGEISFECALWQAISQLSIHEADSALAGSVDELSKYVLGIGQRWGMWTERTRPGEGAAVASFVRNSANATRLAHLAAIRLGRYRRPFDVEREVDWITASVNLAEVDVFLSGANGLPQLDPSYQSLATALSKRSGRRIEHQTYKQLCGEFHSASAFGFSVAVDLVRGGKRGVLLYTLALRGAKALCFVQP
jgi:3-oxoacyl-(acyl-carrier-protein) synthase